ncbi:hypothetical protein [Aquimarina sp. I32.4]|uniref:hypothetical protein n=1 Tax=Aquimarina sp. I32.4 TaxID=2053903 RepID=UPI000CDE7279|nr:hypothetical protein [Aquimarina sp. I32.4]
MKNNLLSFHHYSIKAYDFEKTIEFYNQLGFQSVHHWSLPEFDLKRCEMLYNEVANTYIEICDRDANFPTQGRKIRLSYDLYMFYLSLNFIFDDS